MQSADSTTNRYEYSLCMPIIDEALSEPRNASTAAMATFDLFRDLPREDQADIAAVMRIRKYVEGSFIITNTQTDTEIYFLLSGKVRVCAFSLNGRQVYFDELNAGSMFGEIAAIDGGERSGDCIAIEDVVLAVMSRDDFLKTVSQYPIVLDTLLRRLAGMVRQQMKRVYELTSCSVSQRIRFEILRMASVDGTSESHGSDSVRIHSPPTHADIATRIGIRREAVTRELKKLESLGVITWRPGVYLVNDLSALVKMTSVEG